MTKKDMLPAPAKSGYSKVQHFFWLISGCEISILRSCKSDYNRQAGIGFTIFMTSLFAACSGGYAGFYFTGSIWAAFGFGLIWSLLVFSIDRMLVVTLKKDPTKEKQAVLMPLLGRMVLALLIAFIISIPIELLVFRDQIEIQKRVDKQNGIGSYQTQIENNLRLDDKKSQLLTDSSDEAQNLSDAGNPMTDPTYRNLAGELAVSQRSFVRADGQYTRVKNKLAELDGENDEAGASAYKNGKEYQSARDSYNMAKDDRDRKQAALSRRRAEYTAEKMREYQGSKTSHDSVEREINNVRHKADSGRREMDSLYHKSFIRDFIALENAAYAQQTIKGKVPVTTYVNESLLFFLWLIRLLFFTLEILPTVAKIATPLGAYDRAIYAYEQDMKATLEARSAEYLAQEAKVRQLADEEQLRQEKGRAKMEGKLHDDLMKELSAAQYEIGKQKIEAFRKANIPDTGEIPVT